MIEETVVAHLPEPRRGFGPTVPLAEIVNAILYKLKASVHWRLLPVKVLFSDRAMCWQSVYYHYRKWCVSGTWNEGWIKFLGDHRAAPNLSSVDLDGSHTPAKRSGEQVEYQGRKKARTTNSLYPTDRQGLPLDTSEPVAGNHNDLYNMEVQFEGVTATLERADIPVKGLFLNADAGFDSKDFRGSCHEMEINANICFNKRTGGSAERDEYFDKELYIERYSVERTNAWMDSYRSLLNRFDTTNENWKRLNYLAFFVMVTRKLKQKETDKV